MSTPQHVAHVTGLQNLYPRQVPEPGSLFVPVGGGAPGFLRGTEVGFTLAMGAYLPAYSGGSPIEAYDPPYPLAGDPPYAFLPPGLEILAQCGEFVDGGADGHGWNINATLGQIGVEYPDAASVFLTTDTQGRPGVIMLCSFVADDSFYGGAGAGLAVIGVNGQMDTNSIAVPTFSQSHQFSLGGIIGSPTIEDLAEQGVLSGAKSTMINSFWITPGIPSGAQARSFFDASMEAGRIVPQAWAPARTAADPNPVAPEAPTGHHWDALDVDISQGLGTTWTDRIEGINLELVGASLGDAREVAREEDFYYLPD